MTKPRMIQLVLTVDLVGPEEAVLPKERTGPVTIRITPVEVAAAATCGSSSEMKFRVEFEPENEARRNQPLREGLKPVFPGGWRIGDPWKGSEE